MKIVISGASGYIGGRVVRLALENGFQVVALGRRCIANHGVANLSYDLDTTVTPAIPKDTKALIHLAARTEGIEFSDVDAEVAAAERLIAACPADCRFVFLSSQSADPQSPSGYGLAKWRIEQLVAASGGVSVRPGLVYGGPEMGLFGRLCAALRKLPVYPLFVFPRPIAQPVHVDDLAKALLQVVSATNLEGRLLRLAPSPPIHFDRFLAAILRLRLNRWRPPLPVPMTAFAVLMTLAESISGFKLGSGQLKSLAVTKPLASQADSEELGLIFRPLDEGLVRGTRPKRRILVREGRWLIAYFLKGPAPNGAVRRYVRELEFLNEHALIVSMPLPPALALALLDLPGGDNSNPTLRTRFLLALKQAEATKLGAQRMLKGRTGQTFGPIAAMAAILGNVLLEGFVRTARVLLGPLVVARMLSSKDTA